MFASYEHKGCI